MALRVAVLGLGGIAQKAFLPILTGWEGIELFLSSRTAEKVERYRRQYRVADGSTQVEDIFRWGPEAVFILTPPETHYEFIRRFLEAGVDVFSEKAATYDSRQTQELAELADARGKVLMIGYNRRYSPLALQARQLWGERPVGMAFFEKHRSRVLHTDLYRQLIDDTVHVIDMFRFFCGEAEVIRTSAQVLQGQIAGVISLLALEKGGFGVIAASLKAGQWLERYSLHGDSTSLYLNAFSKLSIVDEKAQQSWQETYDSSWKTTLEGRGFTGQVEHFFNCVNARQQPHTSAWDSVKTQRLVEAIVAKLDA